MPHFSFPALVAGAAAGVGVVEPRDDPVGDQRVAVDAGVGQPGAVRLGTRDRTIL
jgi:hypothetical protein